MDNLIKLNKTKSHIFTDTYLKVYPTFMKLYKYNQKKLIKQDPTLEPQKKSSHTQSDQDPLHSQSGIDTEKVSLRRTKTVMQDIVLSNSFDLFTTFTFSHDRQNIEKCKQKMSNWLQSQQKQHKKNFKYLIVPEFHKDKKSIHFHALLQNYNGNLEYSGIKQKGRKIYNIKSYKGGFSTAVKIDNPAKVSSYIRKYISKDMPTFKGRKRYWCSRDLKRPEIIADYDCQPHHFEKKQKVYSNDVLTIYEIPITIARVNN